MCKSILNMCKITSGKPPELHTPMRINTDGAKEYRSQLFERTADELNENTTTGGIEAACLHARNDIEGKQEAIDYLASELPPRKLERVANMLTTDQVPVEVDVSVSVSE